jgi:hypothetical protein
MVRALDAHDVYRETVQNVVPAKTRVVTMQADTGTATSPRLEPPSAAPMELERRTFRLPGASDVQQYLGAASARRALVGIIKSG